MPDREEVIEKLQKVSRYFKSMLKVGYVGDADIYREHKESVKMAIALLKEQEAVKPKIDAFGHPYCPKCKILVYETWEFCPHCGQAVKWE